MFVQVLLKGLPQNPNLSAPLFLYFEMHMPSIAQAHFLSVSRNFDFLKSTLSPSVIFYVFQKFYNLRKYVRVQKTSLQTFRCHACLKRSSEPFQAVALSMADLHNVMSMLDCLRSCSCSEFQACSCNINYVKTPYLEQLGKDV